MRSPILIVVLLSGCHLVTPFAVSAPADAPPDGDGDADGDADGDEDTDGGDFRANLEADPEVTGRLSPRQLADCFATDLHQAHLGVIWQLLGI